MIDFQIENILFYEGPNFYLNSKAIVFDIFISPNSDNVELYKQRVSSVFTKLTNSKAKYTIDLFAEVLIKILKMNRDISINKYRIGYKKEKYILAVEYIEKSIAKSCVNIVSEWFSAIKNAQEFDIIKKWNNLQLELELFLNKHSKLYSVIDLRLKNNIPLIYSFEDNQIQLGYGNRQLKSYLKNDIQNKNFTQTRIPIISANSLSKSLSEKIYSKFKTLNPNICYSALLPEGVFFNNNFITNTEHLNKQKNILENIETQIALFVHNEKQIFDYGLLYSGSDIVILDNSTYSEDLVLLQQLLPNSTLIEVIKNTVNLVENEKISETHVFSNEEEKDNAILMLIEKYIPLLFNKYSIHK